MFKTYVIYKITNSINGKIYIGMTNNFEQRMREHKSNAKSDKYKYKSRLYNSIRKYGWENFDKETIDFAKNKHDAEEKEKYYISLYNSVDKDVGYNIVAGGTGGKTHDVSGANNPMYGRRYSDEERAKIGSYSRGVKRSGETKMKISQALKGRKRSEEHNRNLSKSLKGKLPKNSHKIKLVNTNTKEVIEFNSEAEMERVLRCSRKTVLKGRTTKNGYKLLESFEEENVETIESIA